MLVKIIVLYKVYDFVDISLYGCRNSSAISVVDCRNRREIPVSFYNGNTITNQKNSKLEYFSVLTCLIITIIYRIKT